MAFLSKYRKLRGTNDTGVREVEYNFGRTFHQLGLYSHAVKHYERVIEMAERAGVSPFSIQFDLRGILMLSACLCLLGR